jgi:hypothetical protein
LATWYLSGYRSFCLYVAVVFATLYAGVFIFLVVRKPEQLQSEAHQLRLRALDIVSEKSRAVRLRPSPIADVLEKVLIEIAPKKDLQNEPGAQ